MPAYTAPSTTPSNPSAQWSAAYGAALQRGNTATNAAKAANQATNNNTTAITDYGYLWHPGASTATPGGSVTVPPKTTTPDTSAADEANKRNIAAQLQALFDSYDLGSLSSQIMQMVQQGMGSDQITLELQNTAAYKTRFAANDVRRSKGMNVLSPAEYIATERAYRQVMSASGLPTGFYDQTSDFQKFLENDVSATEVQQRVQAASDAVYSAPSSTLDIFKQFYSAGDLIAYALDPTKAEPLVERRIKAAEAAAYGQQQGVGITQQTAESLGQNGYTLTQLQSGMQQAGLDAGSVTKLNGIYGADVSSDDLVKSTFGTSADSALKVKQLASQERGSFAGSGAGSAAGLSRNAGGRL